jgi:hypothetical protein
VNLNSTIVFLGIAYIQQSVANNLGFLIPFMSVLLMLIAIHMVRNNLIFRPKKGNTTVTSPSGPRKGNTTSDSLTFVLQCMYVPMFM